MVVFLNQLRDLVQLVRASLVLLDIRDELQLAPVGSQQQFSERGQTIDALFHLRPGHAARAVFVFYLAIVLEEGDVHPVVSMRRISRNLSYILIDTGPMVCWMRVPSMRVLNRLPISSW